MYLESECVMSVQGSVVIRVYTVKTPSLLADFYKQIFRMKFRCILLNVLLMSMETRRNTSSRIGLRSSLFAPRLIDRGRQIFTRPFRDFLFANLLTPDEITPWKTFSNSCLKISTVRPWEILIDFFLMEKLRAQLVKIAKFRILSAIEARSLTLCRKLGAYLNRRTEIVFLFIACNILL